MTAHVPDDVNPSCLEVLDFVRSTALFSMKFNPSEVACWSSFFVIHSLADVNRFRFIDMPLAQIVDVNWADILAADDRMLVGGGISKSEFDQQGKILRWWNSSYGKEVVSLVMAQLLWMPSEEQAAHIASHFDDIGFYRACFGVTDTVRERLFRVYRTGGYPCGWRGRFPTGDLVVYSPGGTLRR